ncbi:hypothetical protein [Phenylobacterium sp.]|uniref:hypothetical protein n=1 Tax=Phenylobacterium sp. TaxID=1871053 RepID=UPI00301DD53D
MFYIQYNEDGYITATVTASQAPLRKAQIELPEPIDVTGLMVDVETGELIPAPEGED